jgi:outer membrane protein OmpA-like peptidoglycan-associated protein
LRFSFRCCCGLHRNSKSVHQDLWGQEHAADASALVTDESQTRFADAAAAVTFERILDALDPLPFVPNQASLNPAALAVLDRLGQLLRAYPRLRADIVATREPTETKMLEEQRARAVTDYLAEKWAVPAARVTISLKGDAARAVNVMLKAESLHKALRCAAQQQRLPQECGQQRCVVCKESY